ncbi:MAG: von Willebrand factor type A domain protein [Deltaproteobacteria bacterium ADurb.Bin510]|nr:MAG: von Willebrand factor type A domain protein [Deltaproteobacteria bacterium ADurb.Bin510]
MLLALAGPRFGSHYEDLSRRGVDIMLVADVSPSMLVTDLKPNRLERAKRELIDFLAGARGDRLGLVAFAGQAYRQCPLTLDYAALEMFIADLGPESAPAPGTDLGAAIDTALEGFDFKSHTDKVIVLLTDGEDNEGKAQAAARRAAARGVRIYVFGLGRPDGGPVVAPDGSLARSETGQPVISQLNESGLESIASLSGGRYVRSVTGDLDLDQIYYAGIKLATRDRELKSAKLKVAEERFYGFVLLALALLMLEGLIRPRRSQP